MHAWIQQERFGVMRRQLAFAFFCGDAHGRWTGRRPGRRQSFACRLSGETVRAHQNPKGEPAKAPEVTIAGNFGQWALVCGKEKDKEGREPCSLVQALVQRESQKLVFRVTVAYGRA